MPRKARRRSTWRASSDSWRASGNWMDMIGLRPGIVSSRCPKNGLSRFHAGVIPRAGLVLVAQFPLRHGQEEPGNAVADFAEPLRLPQGVDRFLPVLRPKLRHAQRGPGGSVLRRQFDGLAGKLHRELRRAKLTIRVGR